MEVPIGNKEPLEFLIEAKGKGETAIIARRGSTEEPVGTFIFPPDKSPNEYYFRNDALDLFCFVDKGEGYERVYFGDMVPFPYIRSIGYGRGEVEASFEPKDKPEDNQ